MDGSILSRVTSATLAYAFYSTKPPNQGELRDTVLQSQQARNERTTDSGLRHMLLLLQNSDLTSNSRNYESLNLISSSHEDISALNCSNSSVLVWRGKE